MLLTDEQLLVESGRGSLPAFELLIQRWDKRMMNYFYRCVGCLDEAEDLRQELFLRLYKSRSRFEPGGAFRAWIYRIATNLIIDKHARKRKPESHVIGCNGEENQEMPLAADDKHSRDSATLQEIKQRVEKALTRIPEEMRIALVMRHFEELSFKEIAQALCQPESTIKTRVYRGLDMLRAELKQMGILEKDCFQTA